MARELITQQNNWLNAGGTDATVLKKRTLTNLYNERFRWLEIAHEKLDRAVLDAYGWPYDIADQDILARLLTLNERRASTGSAVQGQDI